MFKAIIDRASGEPWPTTGMTSAKWRDVPVRTVPIDQLVATQDGVYFHALTGAPTPHGRDPYPHVIRWRGDLYLEDGHHRVTRALLERRSTVVARVLDLDQPAQ